MIGTGSKQESKPEPGSTIAETEKKPAPKKKSGPETVEARVGEVAELRDRTLVVNEVQKGYPPPRQVRMQPGNELMRVYLTLQNTGSQSINYNPLNFKVQDSQGVQKVREVVIDLPYPIEPGSLAPEGTMEGNLVFEVPQGDNNLQLVYEASPVERSAITIGPL